MHSLRHLSDQSLLAALSTLVAEDRRITARLLAHIAEVDARKLWTRAAYGSMHAYCMAELHFSESAAHKRVTAARAARRWPALLDAVADGRLHLTAILTLAPKLTDENLAELIVGATHKTRAEVELFLAERFPRPDLPERIESVGPGGSLAPERVGDCEVLAPERVADQGSLAPERVAPAARPKFTPLAPGRVGMQVTIATETQELLRRAQDLLSHLNCSRDVPTTLHRALQCFVAKLEKQKFALTDAPRAGRGPSRNPRSIPAAVKRAVYQRDGGRCTFIAADGRRCQSRERLEFDHHVPIAQGGGSSVSNLRLLCRPHNQLEADRALGSTFMETKRATARDRRATANDPDGIAFALRRLGIRLEEAREAAEYAATLRNVTLEERVKAALAWRGRRGNSPQLIAPPPAAATAGPPC